MFEAPPPYPGIDPNPTPYQAGPTPAYGYPGPQANGHSQSAAAGIQFNSFKILSDSYSMWLCESSRNDRITRKGFYSHCLFSFRR